MDAEWQLETSYANGKKFKKFNGNHAREYASLFANLEKIKRILQAGHKLGGFRFNFFRAEAEGIYRIGQTGVPSAKESRLYIYFDVESRIIYILNVGDKDTQTEDINEAKQAVRTIRSKSITPSEAA